MFLKQEGTSVKNDNEKSIDIFFVIWQSMINIIYGISVILFLYLPCIKKNGMLKLAHKF